MFQSNLKGGSLNLNEDTLGSHLKAGIAQFVALEFTRGNGRDNRAISRYLPWLYHPPTAMQQGYVHITIITNEDNSQMLINLITQSNAFSQGYFVIV